VAVDLERCAGGLEVLRRKGRSLVPLHSIFIIIILYDDIGNRYSDTREQIDRPVSEFVSYNNSYKMLLDIVPYET
jgi:hypothetical protein